MSEDKPFTAADMRRAIWFGWVVGVGMSACVYSIIRIISIIMESR